VPLSDFDGLLPALATAFGETARWAVPDGSGVLASIFGRFRIDPMEVPLGSVVPEGLNTTQTWFYCDTRAVDAALGRVPGEHDLLFVRGGWYEIVLLDTDDLGELGYRLIKAGDRGPVSR
jgi:hypothetical protein